MAGELFKMMAGVDLLHVPYRGETAAQADLLSDRVQVMFDPVPSVDRLYPRRAIARAGSDRRRADGAAARRAGNARIPARL